MKRYSIFAKPQEAKEKDSNAHAQELILYIKSEFDKQIAPRASSSTDPEKIIFIEKMTEEINNAQDAKEPLPAYRILKRQLELSATSAAGFHQNRIAAGGLTGLRNSLASVFNSYTKSTLQIKIESLIDKLNEIDGKLYEAQLTIS